MPPQTPNVPTETPKHVRHSFDTILKRLNIRWGLNLPTLHGTQETALEQTDAEHPLAKRCTGRIRYLCFRDCQLDKVISDFEEDVPRICSEWVWKPSQERGTLPTLPVTKSYISNRPALPRKHRQTLLNRLFELLNEEFTLARDSEVYSRTSFNSTDAASTGTNKETGIATSITARRHADLNLAELTPAQANASSMVGIDVRTRRSGEAMKRKSSGSEKSAKSSKKQMTLSQMERRRLHPATDDSVEQAPMVRPSIRHETQSVAQSFSSTTVSNDPTDVFSPTIATLNIPSASATTAATSFNQEEEEEEEQEGAKTESDDLFPTQDARIFTADEDFETSYIEACEPAKTDILTAELCKKTPFRKTYVALPHKMLFRHRYEAQRVADALHTSPEEFLHALGRKGISSTSDYDTFWQACWEIASNSCHNLPERSSPEAWKSAEDTFFENDTRKRSVYLGGALSFGGKADEGIFTFKLKPLNLDTSCRLHRRYGPSRFIVLSLPSLSADIPAKFKESARSGVLTETVARWLTTDHHFLGRKWKAFFLEAEKKKSRTVDQIPGYKVHLFAISGEDISAGNTKDLDQFLNWHLAIDQNLESTDLKLFQRLSLGLSKTSPTFPLKASEFVRLPDLANHAVMNDGCARMSMTLATHIAKHIGLNEVPSVFQGRIAGAKGLWMAVPDDEFGNLGERKYCIEIADSQLKIKPHPEESPHAHAEQRTFEVLKYSAPGKPAALNTQLLSVLQDRKVPHKVLGDILVADVGTFHEQLERSMHSGVGLRAWVQSSSVYSRCEGKIKMTGSWPDEAEEQMIMMVESGFTPDKSSTLRECLRSILSNHLDRYVERMQIRIPCSTYLFCIADPYGILEPNEVHLSFSEAWKDPVSGFKENFVDRRDILVARLPASLPSDIQRRQAVWKRELHDFKDVIVFSTKGDIPLAHMLSGGDYDGDMPWICWDKDIVSHFQNADLPKLPSKKDCGLVQKNRRLKDIFLEGASSGQRASQIDTFLRGCFKFNLNSSYLGQCTVEHEKVVYFEGKLTAPGAIKLAALAGYLVDSSKQGDLLTTSAWQKLRKQVSPLSRIDPAWKKESCSHVKRQSNIIDYLKFWRAVPEKHRILVEFNKHWPQEREKDLALGQPWESTLKLSKSNPSNRALQRVIAQLESDIKQVKKDWDRQQPKDRNWTTGQFSHLMDNLRHQFRAIRPSEGIDCDCDPLAFWNYGQDEMSGNWALLRASCLYKAASSSKMVWYVAGEELCDIKFRSTGGRGRRVHESLYCVLNCDAKAAKKAQLRLDGGDFEAETSGREDKDEDFMIERDD